MWYSAWLLHLKSMEFWVLAFTICLCTAIHLWKRSRNGGRRVSLRPPNKTRSLKCVEELSTRYLKGVEELRNSIDEFSDDCGSMKISIKQCQYLRKECLRLVEPPHPYCTLKASFCAVRRALKLMQDCCSENWILKAVEFGNCRRHFFEILLDLHRLKDLIRTGVMAEFDISEESKFDISEETKSEIGEAWESDTAALSSMLESESIHDYPDHCLADQLKANPSLIAPNDIERYVTEFDFLRSPIYQKRDIFVVPVTFCKKRFIVKMRYSKHGTKKLDTILQKEADFMKLCRHPYAVALLGFWEATRTDGKRVPLLLMESMQCNLKDTIERNKSTIERNKRWWWGGTRGFPALDAIDLVLPVAKVMKYLHEIGVVHLDLKPQNILFTRVPGTQDRPEDVSVKLADFGEAQMAEDGVKGTVGTPGYMHPDVWNFKGSVDPFEADVFSFGMVFGEVLTGLSPKEALGCNNFGDFYEKLQGGGQVPLPKETPKFVESIVKSCWKPEQREPNERHRYFDDICYKLQYAEFLLRNGWT